MHALDVHCFHLFLCSSKSFQIPPECMLQRHCFHVFSAIPNRFKYRQNTLFRDIVFKRLSAVQNRFKHCQNACLRDIVFKRFLQFQIVFNTVRMHVLETLFSFFLCSSKSFQIPTGCMPQRHFFHFFSAVPNRFKYRQNACFRDTAPGSYTSCTSDSVMLVIVFCCQIIVSNKPERGDVL